MSRQIHRMSAARVRTIGEPGRYADVAGLWLQVDERRSWGFVCATCCSQWHPSLCRSFGEGAAWPLSQSGSAANTQCAIGGRKRLAEAGFFCIACSTKFAQARDVAYAPRLRGLSTQGARRHNNPHHSHGDRRLSNDTRRVQAPGIVYLQRRCSRGERAFATTGLSIESADQTITLVASVPSLRIVGSHSEKAW